MPIHLLFSANILGSESLSEVDKQGFPSLLPPPCGKKPGIVYHRESKMNSLRILVGNEEF